MHQGLRDIFFSFILPLFLCSSPLPHIAVRFDRQILSSSTSKSAAQRVSVSMKGNIWVRCGLASLPPSLGKSNLCRQLLLNETALLRGNSALPEVLRTGKQQSYIYYIWKNWSGLKCKGQLSVQRRGEQNVRDKQAGETVTRVKEMMDRFLLGGEFLGGIGQLSS